MVLPPSPLPPLSTCLAKGFHSAEASFLCTRHKQLFLLSRLLMLPGELADHFLLTDITPPRNNSLPASTLLIIKMHRYPIVAASPRGQELFAVKVSKDTGATESPRKGPDIGQWNWRCPVAPVVLAATPSLVGECICCSDYRCPVNFLWVNYFKCIQI